MPPSCSFVVTTLLHLHLSKNLLQYQNWRLLDRYYVSSDCLTTQNDFLLAKPNLRSQLCQFDAWSLSDCFEETFKWHNLS